MSYLRYSRTLVRVAQPVNYSLHVQCLNKVGPIASTSIVTQRRSMGIFSDFIDNVKKGFETKEMKESMEQLKETTQKNVKTLKEVSEKTQEKITPAAEETIKTASKVFGKMKDISESVASSPIVEKGAKATQKVVDSTFESTKKAAEKVGQEAEKTEAYKQVQKGTQYLKKELVEDTVLTQAKYHPYEPPKPEVKEKVLKANAISESGPVDENLDAQDIVLHKDSRWEVEWQNFKDNNTVLQSAYEWKMKYDESDNIFVRGFRSVSDKFSEAKESLIGNSDMLNVLEEIKILDPSFEKEEFIEQAHSQYIPLLLESYYKRDAELLETWCSERVYSQLKDIFKQQKEIGVTEECDIREISFVDIFDAVMMEGGPVLNVITRVQQVCVTKDKSGKIISGDPNVVEEVLYYVAFYREEGVYEVGAWKIRDFAIHFRKPMSL